MPHAEASTFAAGQPKAQAYAQVHEQAAALFDGQRNWVANTANAASLLWHALRSQPADAPGAHVNWAGFYFLPAAAEGDGRTLVLGPFQGQVACQTIAFGRGVCGNAAASATTVRVHDVDAYPGHIACDGASRSEIVVPVVRAGRVVAIIDVDCAVVGGFDEVDERELGRLAGLLADACDWPAVSAGAA